MTAVNAIGQAVRRSAGILREEGLRAFWFKLLGETVYRRMLVIEHRFDTVLAPQQDWRNDPQTGPVPAGLDVTVLAPQDVAQYLAFHDYASRDVVLRRLQQGHTCFLVRESGRIIHAAWTATGQADIGYLRCRVRLADDAIYIYEVYTSPDARGRSISSARSRWIAARYRQQGFSRFTAVVWPENAAVIRSLQKAGYRIIGKAGYAGAGRWRRHFFRCDEADPPMELLEGA
jgi:ribosomal protein S18 acetylase RimI-like enzyme